MNTVIFTNNIHAETKREYVEIITMQDNRVLESVSLDVRAKSGALPRDKFQEFCEKVQNLEQLMHNGHIAAELVQGQV